MEAITAAKTRYAIQQVQWTNTMLNRVMSPPTAPTWNDMLFHNVPRSLVSVTEDRQVLCTQCRQSTITMRFSRDRAAWFECSDLKCPNQGHAIPGDNQEGPRSDKHQIPRSGPAPHPDGQRVVTPETSPTYIARSVPAFHGDDHEVKARERSSAHVPRSVPAPRGDHQKACDFEKDAACLCGTVDQTTLSLQPRENARTENKTASEHLARANAEPDAS